VEDKWNKQRRYENGENKLIWKKTLGIEKWKMGRHFKMQDSISG